MLSVLLSVLLSAQKKLSQHHASDSEADSAMVTTDLDKDEVLLEGQIRTLSSPEEQQLEKQRQKEQVLVIMRLTSLLFLLCLSVHWSCYLLGRHTSTSV